MASSLKGPTPQQHDGRGLRVGIVHARWNESIIGPLLDGAKAELLRCGVAPGDIVVQSVPGSWELPVAVQRYVLTGTRIVRSVGMFRSRSRVAN